MAPSRFLAMSTDTFRYIKGSQTYLFIFGRNTRDRFKASMAVDRLVADRRVWFTERDGEFCRERIRG